MKLAVCLLLAGAIVPGTPAAVAKRPRLPYTFEQNQGQAPGAVKFLARGEGYGLFLTEREAVLSLPLDARSRQVIRMSLDGSRTPASIHGIDPSAQTTSYFVGDNPTAWKTNVPNYHRVRYANVYDGVDLVYHSDASQLEYDFILAPRASTDSIKLRFDGVNRMRLTRSGDLELGFGSRRLLHRAPVAYQQQAGGKRIPVDASYQLLGHNRVGFRVGPHDENLPLVIDPVVIYSTFLGGSLSDTVHAVAVDAQGNTYVTGETTSGDFPVKGGGITSPQGALTFAFVAKLNAAGDTIVYSAYLGGSSNTRGYAITVDKDGNAYLGGVTGARNFPLANPVQNTQPGLNIGYVAKLNPQGNALLFSTYIGGERNDEVRDIALDKNGNIHVAGRVTSTQFPVVNALQPAFGGSSDAFAAMYAAPDYRLAYSTFLGGPSAEEANALTLDAAGNTYVTGFAQGSGMATAGAYQVQVMSPNDAFVAKINTAAQLEWFTYYGGRGDDKGNAVALDSFGNVLVGGSATSNNLVTTSSALQPALRGDTDAFLAKFSANGRDLLYATYLGSSSMRTGINESINRIAIGALDAVTIAGVATGDDFPFVRPTQAYGGGKSDGFVARLNSSLAGIEFSTPTGGAAEDTVFGMALDASGGVHVVGDTLSTNFPLKNALRTTFGGAREGFVSHVCDPFIVASVPNLEFTYVIGKAVPAAREVQILACAPIPFQVQAEGDFLGVVQTGNTTNGAITVSVQPANLKTGTYMGQVRITAPDALNNPASLTVILKVNAPPPVISVAGTVHGATALGGPVAPGELIVMYGADMGPTQLAVGELDDQGRMSTLLKETRVYFDGVPAPLVYTSAGQISAVVPYEAAGRTTTRIEVEYRGARSAPIDVPVASTSPGIFTLDTTGSGQGAILNQDYSVNGAANPAARGSVVMIYATGEGQTDPTGVDGAITTDVLRKPVAPVTVTIGGVPAEVLYAGAAPGMVAGVLQVNAVIPPDVATGTAEVRIKAGNVTSRAGVTLAVK